MDYQDIEKDLPAVDAIRKQSGGGAMHDADILWYLLRPLHVAAQALERLAESYHRAHKRS